MQKQKSTFNQFFIGVLSFCVFEESHAAGLLIFEISKSVGIFEKFEPLVRVMSRAASAEGTSPGKTNHLFEWS